MSQEQRDKSVPGSESLELGLDGTSYPWGLSIKTHTLVSRSDDSGDVGMAGNKAMIMVIWCIPSYELLGCWTSYCWVSRVLGDGMNIRIPVCLSFIFRDNIVPVFLYYEKLFINSLVWICRVGLSPRRANFPTLSLVGNWKTAHWQALMEKAFWEEVALPSPIPTKWCLGSGWWFCLLQRWKPCLRIGNKEGTVWAHILASSFRFSLEWNPCSNRIWSEQSLLIWPVLFTFVNLKPETKSDT